MPQLCVCWWHLLLSWRGLKASRKRVGHGSAINSARLLQSIVNNVQRPEDQSVQAPWLPDIPAWVSYGSLRSWWAAKGLPKQTRGGGKAGGNATPTADGGRDHGPAAPSTASLPQLPPVPATPAPKPVTSEAASSSAERKILEALIPYLKDADSLPPALKESIQSMTSTNPQLEGRSGSHLGSASPQTHARHHSVRFYFLWAGGLLEHVCPETFRTRATLRKCSRLTLLPCPGDGFQAILMLPGMRLWTGLPEHALVMFSSPLELKICLKASMNQLITVPYTSCDSRSPLSPLCQGLT